MYWVIKVVDHDVLMSDIIRYTYSFDQNQNGASFSGPHRKAALKFSTRAEAKKALDFLNERWARLYGRAYGKLVRVQPKAGNGSAH